MIQHIKKLFLAMVILSCLTCFQKADYNLCIFSFSIFLWDYKHPNVTFLNKNSHKKQGYSISLYLPGLLILFGLFIGGLHGIHNNIKKMDLQELLRLLW